MRWILLLALLVPAAAPATPLAHPNLLFLTVDDMHVDSVGAFGCPIPGITPRIDRLASEGMSFRRGHVTIAICMPTRAVWLTGRYPHRSGALGFDQIRPEVPTLVESLKAAGYRTGLFAKEPHVVPNRHAAFDEVVKASDLGQGRDPAAYGTRTAAFLAKAKEEGKPFFLMANAQDPHRPFAQGGNGFRRVIRPEEAVVPGFLPDLPDVRKELAQYFTSVHRADETVGAVLDALDAAGLRESTLVFFLSDHGMSFPFSKTNCWVDSTRTPWIVRWPGVVKPGTENAQHFVSGIDVAPTLLEAAGLSSLEGSDGRSILPLLKGEKQEGWNRVFTHLNTTSGRNAFPMRAVHEEGWSYIWNAWSDGRTRFQNESQAGLTMKAMLEAAKTDPAVAARTTHFLYRTPEELYDLKADPHGLRNLAGDPAHAERLAERRRVLLAHLEQTADPQLGAYRARLAPAK